MDSSFSQILSTGTVHGSCTRNTISSVNIFSWTVVFSRSKLFTSGGACQDYVYSIYLAPLQFTPRTMITGSVVHYTADVTACVLVRFSRVGDLVVRGTRIPLTGYSTQYTVLDITHRSWYCRYRGRTVLCTVGTEYGGLIRRDIYCR